MNNFIQNLLGIEDENVIIDDYFTDNTTNTLVVQISLKRTQQIYFTHVRIIYHS